MTRPALFRHAIRRMPAPAAPYAGPRYVGGFSDHEQMASVVVFDHHANAFVFQSSYDLARVHGKHHLGIIHALMDGARAIFDFPIIFHA